MILDFNGESLDYFKEKFKEIIDSNKGAIELYKNLK